MQDTFETSLFHPIVSVNVEIGCFTHLIFKILTSYFFFFWPSAQNLIAFSFSKYEVHGIHRLGSYLQLICNSIQKIDGWNKLVIKVLYQSCFLQQTKEFPETKSITKIAGISIRLVENTAQYVLIKYESYFKIWFSSLLWNSEFTHTFWLWGSPDYSL